MRERRWLPDVVGDDERPPLTASLGRYPGAVWSLGLWFLIGVAMLVFSLVTGQGSTTGTSARAVLVGYSVLVLVVLAVWGPGTPRWFLRAQVLVSLACATLLLVLASQDLGVALIMWSFLGIAVYTAFWDTRAWLVVILIGIAVSSLAALLEHGLTTLLATQWLIAIAACCGLGFILNVLLRQFQRESLIDPLTGVLNRRGLQLIIDRRARSGQDDPRTLAVIDLDNFKAVNDQHGHEEGDRVLASIGETLRDGLRKDDVAVRSGGDEFMLVMHRTELDEADAVVHRILVDAPIAWSIGLADWSGSRPFDEALAEADAAMYSAKRDRRQR